MCSCVHLIFCYVVGIEAGIEPHLNLKVLQLASQLYLKSFTVQDIVLEFIFYSLNSGIHSWQSSFKCKTGC